VESTLEGTSLDTWLIIMALMTCTVGIANAVLMSVTERFREIGTMKCLGAQDSLVVKMFLLESVMLGMVGALMGIALGVLVALAAGVTQFGGFGLHCFPLAQGVWVVCWSLVAGMFLAVVGAVYPVLVAARMQPVDALRADE
jgi:ABC-type antimicrobial peptide transport system permease subunit